MSEIQPTASRQLHGGEQRVFHFPNGYGASVVRHPSSYGYEDGLWELAVVLSGESEDPYEFEITYATPVTDDVRGDLSDADVQDILAEIRALPKVGLPLPERVRETDVDLKRTLGALARLAGGMS